MKYYQDSGDAPRRGFRIGPGALSPFIKVMILVNLGVFIAQNLYPSLTVHLGLSPKNFFADFPNLIYQPFTYMFLHGDFWHIFFNMFVLWMFGTEIEFNLGTRRFARFYILAGLAGAVLTMIAKSYQTNPMIGASAAVYGVMAAYWVSFPQRYVYLYFLFPIKVKWFVPGFMLLGFLFGGPHVAHFAHLGGAVFGFIYFKSDWRLWSFSRKIKDLRYRRQSAKLEKNRQKAEEIMKRVDDILDKINEVGIENISKEDRKFLEEASSRLSDKKMKE
ncbi:MAG: rhomboid family intramembrane serine protease [Candidatus Zixiibacteriota bacterium]|nr:MAG: rhomboid family intramembrane serine protease [candidate division Zixibacteria bacterium]